MRIKYINYDRVKSSQGLPKKGGLLFSNLNINNEKFLRVALYAPYLHPQYRIIK